MAIPLFLSLGRWVTRWSVSREDMREAEGRVASATSRPARATAGIVGRVLSRSAGGVQMA